MSTQATGLLKEIPPAVSLLNLTIGHWVTQGIYVAAKLGIADFLRRGPMTVGELAELAGVDPRSLYRLLRALSSSGIFSETTDGRFVLTPMAECLQADVPGSIRAWALMLGEPYNFNIWSELLHSVRTGETTFNHVHGVGVFEYFAQHPEQGRLFDEAMTSHSVPEVSGVLSAYDFSGIGALVDIAGGHGTFLEAILKAYPDMKGILADLPPVLEGARPRIAASQLDVRCELIPIDFFASVPAGGDAYMMKHIIHDWDDERAKVILGNCHRAMAGQGKLLLVEMVMLPGNDPDFGKWLDVGMLVYAGGCERTVEEYRDLLAASGFRLTRIVPTPSPVSVIEAIPV